MEGFKLCKKVVVFLQEYFVFFLGGRGCTCGMWKLLVQGSNPRCICDLIPLHWAGGWTRVNTETMLVSSPAVPQRELSAVFFNTVSKVSGCVESRRTEPRWAGGPFTHTLAVCMDPV